MKTIKFLRFFLMFAAITSMVLVGCEKDDDDDNNSPTPPTSAPYQNLNDDSTSAITVAIPRIDVTGSRDGALGIYLSATNQDGWAFSQFTSGNFIIEITNLSNEVTSTVAIISFVNISTQGGNIGAAMTLDYSGSMSSSDITNMETAVKYFANLKASNDQIALVKFASAAEYTLPFTVHAQDVITAVDAPYTGSGGSTAWYNAIDLGLDEANLLPTSMIPAIIAFTDGYDNNSNVSQSDVIAKANQFQIPIYTLGFGGANQTAMETIATSTGGSYLYAPDSHQLDALYQKINGQLKNLYMANVTFVGVGNYLVTVTVTYVCQTGTLSSAGTKGFTYP